MSHGTNRMSGLGILFLRLSFALQVLLLIASYTNLFSSLTGSPSLRRWASSFADTAVFSVYISVGSCATQFFLIRLFRLRFSESKDGMAFYLICCAACVIYNNWYLVRALLEGLRFGPADVAHFAFDLVLSLLVLAAVMSGSHVLSVFCAAGCLAMTAYNILVILAATRGVVSVPVLAGMIACETLYGAGLAFCLFGIRKPGKNVPAAEKPAPAGKEKAEIP